jgi:hypothetical protein
MRVINEEMKKIFGFNGPQFSDIKIVGYCHRCLHVESMQARDYEKKICRKCLKKDAVLIKLGWLDTKGMKCGMYLDNYSTLVPMLWKDYK